MKSTKIRFIDFFERQSWWFEVYITRPLRKKIAVHNPLLDRRFCPKCGDYIEYGNRCPNCYEKDYHGVLHLEVEPKDQVLKPGLFSKGKFFPL